MAHGQTHVLVALVAALGLSAAACASQNSVKLSSKALCENAGGTYAQGVCTPGTAKKADAICMGFGGIYLTDEDLCHIGK